MSERFQVHDSRPNIPSAQYYEYKDITYPYEEISEFPLTDKKGMDRYLPLLPVESLHIMLPGQDQPTPVSMASHFGNYIGKPNLWIKHEEFNPTGSFKDRESAVVISAAIEQGVKRVNILSSGNAALSTAAHAQAAGIECVAYVPAGNNAEKMSLIRLFGATLITREGIYEDMYKSVVDEQPEGWNVTTGQNEYRMEGSKTIAFELYEEFGENVDAIYVPTGAGSCLASIWKGYKELQLLGKINKLPKMIAVQAAGGDPIAHALSQGVDFVSLGTFEDSIAEGIAAEEAFCSPKAVKALQESGGYTISVSNEEIIQAIKDIIRLECFIPEPTAGAVYAGLAKDQQDHGLIVAINTGSGLKTGGELGKLLLDK